MMSRNFRVVAVVLVLTLGMTGAASALGPRAEARTDGSLFGQALDWVASFVSQTGSGLRSIWENAGLEIDPDGAKTNSSGYIDPNGGPTIDGGGSIDPNG